MISVISVLTVHAIKDLWSKLIYVAVGEISPLVMITRLLICRQWSSNDASNTVASTGLSSGTHSLYSLYIMKYVHNFEPQEHKNMCTRYMKICCPDYSPSPVIIVFIKLCLQFRIVNKIGLSDSYHISLHAFWHVRISSLTQFCVCNTTEIHIYCQLEV